MTSGALWDHSGPILESPWTEIRNIFLICLFFFFAPSRLGGNREAKSIVTNSQPPGIFLIAQELQNAEPKGALEALEQSLE